MNYIVLLFTVIFSFNLFAAQNVRLEIDVKVPNHFANKARFVYIVDNSGSMASSQAMLGNTVAPTIQPLIDAGLDFELILLGTDSFTTGYYEVFSHSDPNVINNFSAAIKNLGTNGGAVEKQIESLAKIIPMLNAEETFLNIISVSDEEDQSDITLIDSTIKDLIALNSNKSDLINVYGITFDESKNCRNKGNGQGVNPIDEVIATIGNLSKKFSICDSTIVTDGMIEMAMDTIDSVSAHNPSPVYLPVKTISLAMSPIFSSMVVRFGTQVFSKGQLPGGYIFRQTTNQIEFGDMILLKPQAKGTKLVVEYETSDDIATFVLD